MELPHIFIDGIDKSNLAIENTEDNIKKFNCNKQIKTSQFDIIEDIPLNSYDVILSNPPYIPLSTIPSLDPCVQYYDPMNALTDYNDGMLFYRRIYMISKNILNDGGLIVLEFGDQKQCEEIIKIFYGFSYELIYDLNQKPRGIVLQ